MTRNVNIGEMPILQTRDSQQMIDEIVGMLSQGRQPLQQIAEPNHPTQTQKKPMSFSQAFKQARAAGKNVFEWNGKKYTTEIKGSSPHHSTKQNTSPSRNTQQTSQTKQQARSKTSIPQAGDTSPVYPAWNGKSSTGRPQYATPNKPLMTDVLGVRSTVNNAMASYKPKYASPTYATPVAAVPDPLGVGSVINRANSIKRYTTPTYATPIKPPADPLNVGGAIGKAIAYTPPVVEKPQLADIYDYGTPFHKIKGR